MLVNSATGLPGHAITRASMKASAPGARSRLVLSTITNKTNTATTGKSVKDRPKRVAARRLNIPAKAVEELMELDDLRIQIDFKKELEKRVKKQRRRLPENVVDIDGEDHENAQLCAEYAPEMYAYLRTLEGRFGVRADYLKGFPTTGKMRTVLVDWLVDVQQQFKLLQETLYLSIAIIDRFMSIEGHTIDREFLQLVGISAMFLASKLEEIYAPELNDFVYITDNAYTASQVRDMEKRIFKVLDFDFGIPLSINFLRRYSKAGDVDISHHALAKYILEAILLDYSMVSTPPSLCAATALYLSLGILEATSTELWTPTLQHYSGYTGKEVHDKVKPAIESLKKAHSGKYTAVKQKFSSKQMHRIATNDQLAIKLSLL